MKNMERNIRSAILIYAINTVVGLVEFILGMRILLKLFDASASAPFTNWIYETSSPLIAPFRGMFPHPALDGVFVIEFSTIFALIFYALVGYFLVELVEFVSTAARRPRGERL
jgi:uncharacterized protein YggT (Ycf19 family)